MDFLQKRGFWMVNFIDPEAKIWRGLQTKTFMQRVFLYVGLILGAAAAMEITGWLTFQLFIYTDGFKVFFELNNWLFSFQAPILTTAYIIYKLIYVGLITSLVIYAILFESIIKLDADDYLPKIHEKYQDIKKRKLNWWRLRNIHIFFRIPIYMYIFFYFYSYLQLLFAKMYIESLNNQLPMLLIFATIIYLIISIYITVLIEKRIKYLKERDENL